MIGMVVKSIAFIVRSRKRWGSVLVLAVVGVGVLWTGWRWWDVRRDRTTMTTIQAEMGAGRYGRAVRELTAVLAWNPGADEAAYFLGVCEKARGRPQAASEAWTRISPDSPFCGRAILGRTGLLIETGHLAEAEQVVEQVAAGSRTHGPALRILLIAVYCQQGRIDEAERLIESRWEQLDATDEADSEQAINLARLHMELRWNIAPVEAIRTYLEQAARLAPDDDRIWLGRANLAIRVGSYDEAQRWLDDCLRNRPDDVPVWRARLNWALATHRVTEAMAAMKHLPAEESSPAQIHRLAAWLAARRGDIAWEHDELEALVAADPEDFQAREQLAKQAAPGRAAARQHQKAEIEQLQARYRELYTRNQPSRDGEEMAQLAERLGRRFEARVFLTAAVADQPDRTDLRDHLARLDREAGKRNDTKQSLFDALRAEGGADRFSQDLPAQRSAGS